MLLAYCADSEHIKEQDNAGMTGLPVAVKTRSNPLQPEFINLNAARQESKEPNHVKRERNDPEKGSKARVAEFSRRRTNDYRNLLHQRPECTCRAETAPNSKAAGNALEQGSKLRVTELLAELALHVVALVAARRLAQAQVDGGDGVEDRLVLALLLRVLDG